MGRLGVGYAPGMPTASVDAVESEASETTGDADVSSITVPLDQDADLYTLLLFLVPTTAGAVLQSRLQTASGIVSAGGSYAWNATQDRSLGALVGNSSDSSSVINIAYDVAAGGIGVRGKLEIYDAHAGRRTSVMGRVRSAGSLTSNVNLSRVAGIYLATTAVTGIQFFFSTGNIAAGYSVRRFYR